MNKLLLNLGVLLVVWVHAGISELTFVAFDVETTDSTHWLNNPGRPIRNSQIHGITDNMSAGYPAFSNTYPGFSVFVGDAVLLAHNASFDGRFMAAKIERNKRPPLPNPTINSLTLFRRWFPDADSHKIGFLAASLNIPVAVEHRAEDDSATLLRIFDRGLESRQNTTLAEIAATANGTYYFDGTRKP